MSRIGRGFSAPTERASTRQATASDGAFWPLLQPTRNPEKQDPEPTQMEAESQIQGRTSDRESAHQIAPSLAELAAWGQSAQAQKPALRRVISATGSVLNRAAPSASGADFLVGVDALAKPLSAFLSRPPVPAISAQTIGHGARNLSLATQNSGNVFAIPGSGLPAELAGSIAMPIGIRLPPLQVLPEQLLPENAPVLPVPQSSCIQGLVTAAPTQPLNATDDLRLAPANMILHEACLPSILAHPIWQASAELQEFYALISTEIGAVPTPFSGGVNLGFQIARYPLDDAQINTLSGIKSAALICISDAKIPLQAFFSPDTQPLHTSGLNNEGAVFFDFRAWATGLLAQRGTDPAPASAASTQFASPVGQMGSSAHINISALSLTHGTHTAPGRAEANSNQNAAAQRSAFRKRDGADPAFDLTDLEPTFAPPPDRVEPRNVLIVQPDSDNVLVWVRDYQSTPHEVQTLINHLRVQLMMDKRLNLRLVINGSLSIDQNSADAPSSDGIHQPPAREKHAR
jgi:hypothetical protein